LQTLENFDNTISIHDYNYQQKLLEISNRTQIKLEELTTFSLFIEKTTPYLQRQIKADLGYFKHGTDLVETAIASIRGIVEIEQVESDRNLQTLVAIVGVGIGSAGVAATASPYFFAAAPSEKPQHLAYSVLFSLFVGILGAAMANRAIKRIQLHPNGTIAKIFNYILGHSK